MEGQISFVKMEGAGNDYVYVDCFDQYVKNPQLLARKVSSRHFGVGSDGLILLKPSQGLIVLWIFITATAPVGEPAGMGCAARPGICGRNPGRQRQICALKHCQGYAGPTSILSMSAGAGFRWTWAVGLSGTFLCL